MSSHILKNIVNKKSVNERKKYEEKLKIHLIRIYVILIECFIEILSYKEALDLLNEFIYQDYSRDENILFY